MIQVSFPTGRFTRYAKSEIEAESIRRGLIMMRDTGLSSNSDRMEAALEKWLEARWVDVLRDELTEGTWQRYEQVTRLYLIPGLGKHRVIEITPRQVDTFLGRRALDGVGIRQQYKCYQALLNCFNWLMQGREVPDNPIWDAQKPRYRSPKKRSMTPAEVRKVLQAAESDRLGALWTLMPGFRISEALGLSWEYVDWHDNLISTEYQQSRPGGPGARLVGLKTDGSKRRIPMNKIVRERLEAHWERHGKPKSGFVFVTEHGTPFLHRNASRDLIKFLKKQGITDITPHQLRHTTDVDLMIKVYTHAMDEAKREAVEWTDELLSEQLSRRYEGSRGFPRALLLTRVPAVGFEPTTQGL